MHQYRLLLLAALISGAGHGADARADLVIFRAQPQAAATIVGLKAGEYACYGSGGQVLAGFGFKVLPGERFTDLDDGNAGTYKIVGSEVTFSGGHLDGTVGRELKNGSFRIGLQASCEPWG